MTRKGKRDGALRKMGHAEASAYLRGGLFDEAFSVGAAHAALKGTGVDLAAFDAFFGPRIGRHRDYVEDRKTRPKIADELVLIEEAMESIDQTRRRLEFLPPHTDAEINLACWQRHHELFDDRQRRLDADLKEMWALLVLAERALEPRQNVKPQSALARDTFLHDVAHWLQDHGMRPTAAARAAADVLHAVGVDVTNDPKKARELVLAVEKSQEQALAAIAARPRK